LEPGCGSTSGVRSWASICRSCTSAPATSATISAEKYVFDNGPTVDAFSPDNILCFMNGPLMAVVTKSPLTGTVTDSHHGGWSAARLKWSR